MSKWLDTLYEEMQDHHVQEIMINDVRSMLFVQGTAIIQKKSLFSQASKMIEECQMFALEQGKRLDPLYPFAGGELRDNFFRWHCLIPPATAKGPIFSLRRHLFDQITLDDYLISKNNKDLLLSLFKQRKSLLLCGSTGSGKTTLLNTLLQTHAFQERVVFLEELEELPLASHFWIKLLKKEPSLDGTVGVSLQALFEQSLRLRPDRIVLGEIRGLELMTFLESLTTGHHGCLSTIHAGNMQELRTRINFILAKKQINLSMFSSIDDLWCVFLERGQKPKIKSIEKIF